MLFSKHYMPLIVIKKRNVTIEIHFYSPSSSGGDICYNKTGNMSISASTFIPISASLFTPISEFGFYSNIKKSSYTFTILTGFKQVPRCSFKSNSCYY